jgi:hypothetical protein
LGSGTVTSTTPSRVVALIVLGRVPNVSALQTWIHLPSKSWIGMPTERIPRDVLGHRVTAGIVLRSCTHPHTGFYGPGELRGRHG